MRAVATALCLGLAGWLSACASATESYVTRTATEQLLIARAADRAVHGLALPLPPQSKVFVDGTYLTGENAPYALSALRSAVAGGGHALVTREQADVVFEVRAGALSLEQMRRVLGIPEMRLPINESLNVVSLPELSLYSRRDRAGVVEFSGFLYDARSGAPLGVITPLTGEFRIRSHKLFMVIPLGQQRVEPGQKHLGPSWTQF